MLSVAVVMLGAWACLALWVHMPLGRWTYVIMGLIAVTTITSFWEVGIFHHSFDQTFLYARRVSYAVLVAGVMVWFFGMKPSNNRLWQDEFRHQFSYYRDGDVITVRHVRNFHWYQDKYIERWETRTYHLSHLDSLDMISTTWGNENIAHIMVSFGFDDGMGNTDRLVFSVETRKEVGEDFSSISGFFRLYDLSIIAGDERDLIYTRTNIRQEQVSVYPILYDKDKMKALFLTYLDYGQRLHESPEFYHALTSNCTTVIYKMIQSIDKIPMDYRVIVSGRLADYLYEKKAIDNHYDLPLWKQRAFANPKVSHLGNNSQVSSKEYSSMIREGLPTS